MPPSVISPRGETRWVYFALAWTVHNPYIFALEMALCIPLRTLGSGFDDFVTGGAQATPIRKLVFIIFAAPSMFITTEQIYRLRRCRGFLWFKESMVFGLKKAFFVSQDAMLGRF
jgi:hypothetical protein